MLPKAGVKMKLLIASNNKKKINELKDILKDSFEVISLREAGVESDPEENGDTCLLYTSHIVLHKVQFLVSDKYC